MKPTLLASLALGMAASAYGAENARYIVLDTIKTSTMQKELQEAAKGYRFVGQTLFENWMGAREYLSILERPIP